MKQNKAAIYIFIIVTTFICYKILGNFIVPMIWSSLIVLATFPFYKKLNNYVKNDKLSSFLMSFLVASLLIIPSFFILYKSYDLVEYYIKLINDKIPLIVDNLDKYPHTDSIVDYLKEKNILNEFKNYLSSKSEIVLGLVSNIGKITSQLLFIILFNFCLYTYGEKLSKVAINTVQALFGKNGEKYLITTAKVIPVIFKALIISTIIQICLSILLFSFTGIEEFLFLGFLLGLSALIPLLQQILYFIIGFSFYLLGYTNIGIIILFFGVLILAIVDTVIRPYLMMNNSDNQTSIDMPFMLIFIGAIGGMSAFGFMGLFIGPILLSTVMTLWNEWLLSR